MWRACFERASRLPPPGHRGGIRPRKIRPRRESSGPGLGQPRRLEVSGMRRRGSREQSLERGRAQRLGSLNLTQSSYAVSGVSRSAAAPHPGNPSGWEQRRRKRRATRASTPLDEIEDAFGPYDRRETDSVRSDGWGPSRASKLVRRCLPAREPDARRDFADAGVSLLQALLGTAERRAAIVCGGRRRRAEDFGPRSG